MKRDIATERLNELISNIDKGGRHAQMVDEVWLFGSYARGALEPGDIDLEVVITGDAQYNREVVNAMSGYRHPRPDLLRELRGTRRCFEILVTGKRELNFPETVLLYRRGDDLATMKARVEAIDPDPAAGKAPRDPVVPVLEGIDKELGRAERAELSSMVSANWIEIDRVELPDAPDSMATPAYLEWNYRPTSPLLRAALAACHYLESQEVNRHQMMVSNLPLCDPTVRGDWPRPGEITHRIWWKNCVLEALWFLSEETTEEYVHILNPTKSRPIEALFIRSGSAASKEKFESYAMCGPGGAQMREFPELDAWLTATEHR